MTKTSSLRRLAILCAIGATVFGVTAGVGNAKNPTGTCPNDGFSQYGTGVAFTDPILQATDKNGDGYLCFKPNPSAQQTGGNIIDNTAAPHS